VTDPTDDFAAMFEASIQPKRFYEFRIIEYKDRARSEPESFPRVPR
jgi:hypothetical protein